MSSERMSMLGRTATQRDKKRFVFSIKKAPFGPNVGNTVLNKTTGTKLKDILVFGVPLTDLRMSHLAPPIPLCLFEMIQLIRENLGGKEEYFNVDSLVPNTTTDIGSIRKGLQKGIFPDLSSIKCSLVVAELLRAWLAELPEPLFTASKRLIFLMKSSPNDAVSVEELYACVQSLPPLNYNSVQQTISLLVDMVGKSPTQQQQLEVICSTLGPLMLKSPAADDCWAQQALHSLIDQYTKVFGRSRVRNNVIEWNDMYDSAWWEEPTTSAERQHTQLTDFLTASTITLLFDPRVSAPDDYSLELSRAWTADYIRGRCVRDKRRMVSYGPHLVLVNDEEGTSECDYKVSAEHTIVSSSRLENYINARAVDREDFARVDQLEVGIIFKDLSEGPEQKKEGSERRKEAPMKASRHNPIKEPKLW